MSLEEQKKSILDHITCYCCYEIINGKYSSCKEAHNICQKCYLKLSKPIQKCGLCSQQINNNYDTIRVFNIMLAAISDEIIMQCPNNNDEIIKLKDYYNHIKICQFKPLRCIIKLCDFTGNFESLKKHIITKHNMVHIKKTDIIQTYKTNIRYIVQFDKQNIVSWIFKRERNFSKIPDFYEFITMEITTPILSDKSIKDNYKIEFTVNDYDDDGFLFFKSQINYRPHYDGKHSSEFHIFPSFKRNIKMSINISKYETKT
jgi:hypothetical protein